ncbi:tautomerase family protein [Halobacillus shinanisalinarum]|uniref:Tautomerase family protein n=1 Tax=Halobacillus shinanisalinarum TaxID=2932258 RepID=A0ABY4GYN2_9BACI|nr:tautomerase family protein [Halobacillus shinanisalinarum]UOQ93312.1 tautomerase family protein [Halobacillus shinanisalinarum]
MPLVRFDIVEGRSKEELQSLLDASHEAMVYAFEVPERDRYQIVHQHPAHEMIIQDTGLGFERSKDVVVISLTSRPRTEQQKENLYHNFAVYLQERCDISPENIMVSIANNGDADWSFGNGEVQFLTGLL